jgi:hypothetical protein
VTSLPTLCTSLLASGRGPLVRASLAAAEQAGQEVHVYAVEKNPCALVHIQAMVAREGWQQHVTIVAADMRTWEVRGGAGGDARGGGGGGCCFGGGCATTQAPGLGSHNPNAAIVATDGCRTSWGTHVECIPFSGGNRPV